METSFFKNFLVNYKHECINQQIFVCQNRKKKNIPEIIMSLYGKLGLRAKKTWIFILLEHYITVTFLRGHNVSFRQIAKNSNADPFILYLYEILSKLRHIVIIISSRIWKIFCCTLLVYHITYNAESVTF